MIIINLKIKNFIFSQANFLNKINNNCILFFQYILIIKRKKNVIYAIKSIYTLIEYKYFNNSLSSINFDLLNI
jgi:hypothetical protein